jgi:hypothetical protein
MAFKLNGWSAFTKMDPPPGKDNNKDKKKDKDSEETFEPVWMGADISKKEWDKMTEEQKARYKKKGLSTME